MRISALGPVTDADRGKLAEDIATELERRGAERPIVEIEVVQGLPQGALGKTPLITALKLEQRSGGQ